METLHKTKVKDVFQVDPRSIVNDESQNIREVYNNIDSLKASILSKGVLTPLRARYDSKEDKYHLTDGYRRMRAITAIIKEAEAAGQPIPKEVERVLVLKEPADLSGDDRLVRMVIANQSEPLTPLEEGQAFKILYDEYGYTQAKIAEAVGKTQAHVSNALKLAALPDELKDKLRSGAVSANVLLKLASGSESIEAAAEKLHQAEELAKETGKTKVTPSVMEQVERERVPRPSKAQALIDLLDIVGVDESGAPISSPKISVLETLIDFIQGDRSLEEVKTFFNEK